MLTWLALLVSLLGAPTPNADRALVGATPAATEGRSQVIVARKIHGSARASRPTMGDGVAIKTDTPCLGVRTGLDDRGLELNEQGSPRRFGAAHRSRAPPAFV